ncbi:MAG: hypothetical protein Q8Q28_03375 [Pseudomonadota bacterium]|nr:hypothetical protein [Pseudomonadota bacterium]
MLTTATESPLNNLAEVFGQPIHTYTRAQAIEDGMLVDVSEMAREAGFGVAVALSRAAWLDCVEWTDADSRRQTLQDQSGRLWDVVHMASLAARRNPRGEERIAFPVYRVPRGGRGVRPLPTTMQMQIGPGDEGEPVITIMMPGED